MSTQLAAVTSRGPEPVPPWPEPPGRSRGRARIVAGVVLACIGIAGIALGFPGVALLQHRDDDGFYTTSPRHLQSDGYAIVGVAEAQDISLPLVGTSSIVDQVRLQGVNNKGADDLFIGIGPADLVSTYLQTVPHSVVNDLDGPATPSSNSISDVAPESPPTEQTFWLASGTAEGQVEVLSEIPDQDWAVVVMNADGSRDIDTHLSVGAEFPIVDTATWTAYIVGAVALAGGIAALASGIRARRRTNRSHS